MWWPMESHVSISHATDAGHRPWQYRIGGSVQWYIGGVSYDRMGSRTGEYSPTCRYGVETHQYEGDTTTKNLVDTTHVPQDHAEDGVETFGHDFGNTKI